MNILQISCDSTNYYLIECRDGYLMVDICFPNSLPKLLKSIERYGIEPKQIKYLLMTHFHPDHAGAAQDIKQYGTKLIVHSLQIPYIDQMKKYFKPQDSYHPIQKEDMIVLDSENSIEFFEEIGISGFLIETPGHSDGSVTFIVEKKSAFTGDLGHPLLYKGVNEKIDQSWEKMYKLNIKMIYPGHGVSFDLTKNSG